MTSLRRKLDLYILSLGLLFLFFVIITINIPLCFGDGCYFVGLNNLIAENIVAVISLFFLLYCVYAYKSFDFALKGSLEIPFEIRKIQGINYEHLTFLATYVVPLISFDFESSRQMIVLALLLVVMGVIYIKTDLFYANPSLALLGFHIYQGNGNFKIGDIEDIIMISRTKLVAGKKVSYIKLDERIYYVKGVA